MGFCGLNIVGVGRVFGGWLALGEGSPSRFGTDPRVAFGGCLPRTRRAKAANVPIEQAVSVPRTERHKHLFNLTLWHLAHFATYPTRQFLQLPMSVCL